MFKVSSLFALIFSIMVLEDLQAVSIAGNIYDAEYVRPNNNIGRAGSVKFRRLSIDTPSVGITLSNGRVFDSSIRMNRRYISFSGSNHSFGFSFTSEKTLEFADYFHVQETSFDLRSNRLQVSSDLVKYGKNSINASFINFKAICNAYPRKSFSDTENIYYGCLHSMSVLGKDGEAARLEATSVIDRIGTLGITTDVISAETKSEEITAALNNSKVTLDNEDFASLPNGLIGKCKKDSNVIGNDYNKVFNTCFNDFDVVIPRAEVSGTVTKNGEHLLSAQGEINNIKLSTTENISLSTDKIDVNANGVNIFSESTMLACVKNKTTQFAQDTININGRFEAMLSDCSDNAQAQINNFRFSTMIGENDETRIATFARQGDLLISNEKINFKSNDLYFSYGESSARVTNISASCTKATDFTLNATSFDQSCSKNSEIKPLDNHLFSYVTASIPNDEGSYELRGQLKSVTLKDNKIKADIGRTKLTIAPNKDIYINQVKTQCLNAKESLLKNTQGVLDRCLTDLTLEPLRLVYQNEVDNYRYYTEMPEFKLANDRLIANIYGVQMKGKDDKSTSVTISDIRVNCFRPRTLNPLHYQEQVDYCLENATVDIDKIILPNKRQDVRGLYNYYQTMVSSTDMSGTSPIAMALALEVGPKVKDIRIRANDLNVSMSVKAKVAGVWISVSIAGRVTEHDKEHKTVTIRRTSASIAPFILNTGIKMAVPESLVKVVGDSYVVKYY